MKKPYQILILPENKRVPAEQNALLSDVLRACGMPGGPCGGKGFCGKCEVELIFSDGVQRVLACQTRVNSDLTVRQAPCQSLHILMDDASAAGAAEPSAKSVFQHAPQLAIAFDIGTTTLVCSLIDLEAERALAVCGAENPQTVYGADVMTRLLFALEHGVDPLQSAVLSGMRSLVCRACAQANVSPDRIQRYTAVGNTAMQHLLFGLDPTPLTRAPYHPASAEAVFVSASELDLPAAPGAMLCFPPLIAGFVGADTAACLLATDFDRQSGITLLIDIGTNGELVLGSGAKRIACSAAAGPAFEGAALYSGMRAESGAIFDVCFDDSGFHFSVLDDTKPRGVCGSGLIALVACLLKAGALDTSGRLRQTGALGNRVIPLEEQRAFVIADANESATGRPILLTQKDVRALQLAKAAISCATELLCRAYGIAAEQIDRILLAGGFGSALSVQDAHAIGLLPHVPESRVVIVGNAALRGAVLASLDQSALSRFSALAASTTHLALAEAPDFNERFLNALAFPTPNIHKVEPV